MNDVPKFFIVSDVHSHYRPLKRALEEKGFDPNNEDHWLISCGDLFDRGNDSEEVFLYIMSLPRKILVKGNHDILLEELCTRGFPYSHDGHNGTVRTVNDIGGAGFGRPFDECCEVTYNKMARYRELLVNYFETQNYIFVHSWVPTIVECNGTSKPWYQVGKTHSYKEDWRNATDSEWEEAMWGNPFWKAQDGLNQTGKTIVFGHWHCSLGHLCDSDGELTEFGEDAIWEPYINKHQGIIGIDRCTAHTGEVNVLVIEDGFLGN